MKQLTQKIAAIAIVMIGFAHTATAQVKVGDNPTSISASSVLELESTNKGLVLTRLTTAQMNAITGTALNGMVVFNTDAGCVFQKRSGSWHSLCSINVDSLAKAVMQSPVKDSIAKLAAGAEPWYNTTTGTGATTNTQNIYQMGNVGIGTTTPTEKLHLAGNMRINNNFRTHTEIINLPATVNDIVNFATETNLNGSANYRISVTVPTSSYSQTKTYIISSQYAAGGGLWKTVTPLTSTNVYAGNSFDLEFYNNNSIDSFRLRNTSGGIVGTAYIFFEETGNVALNTYTSITGTDISGTTSSGTLNPYSGIVQEPWYNVATNTGATANTQDIYQMGNVGIGTSTPTEKICSKKWKTNDLE